MALGRPSQSSAGVAAEHELVLRLCGTAAAREQSAGRIAELVESASLEAFARTASAHGLLALLVKRLAEAVPGGVPAELEQAAEREADRCRHAAALQQAVTGRVLERLADDDIPALALKGPALAEAAYGDAGLRRSADIDILVDAAQLGDALSALRDIGYGDPLEEAWEGGLPILHYTLVPLKPWLPELELHWRIHWYETSFSRGLLARSVPDADGRRRARADDELAAMLLFFQRDSFAGLRHATDVAALWDAHRDELPAGALDPLMERHPELQQALVAAVRAAERLVGLPAGELVSPEWRMSRRAGVAVRLANPTPTSVAEAAADMTAVDWLLTPRGQRLAFLRRYFFQPPAAMARTYGFPEDARVRGRAHQLVRGSARLARFLVAYSWARWRAREGGPTVAEAV